MIGRIQGEKGEKPLRLRAPTFGGTGVARMSEPGGRVISSQKEVMKERRRSIRVDGSQNLVILGKKKRVKYIW